MLYTIVKCYHYMGNYIIVMKIIRFSYEDNRSKNIFDKIDREKSSKEVLTEEEYVQYIRVLSAKSNSSGSAEDREEFLQAESFKKVQQ